MMKRITIAMLLALVAVSGVGTWAHSGDIAAHLDDVEASYDVVGRECSPASNEIGMGLESTP